MFSSLATWDDRLEIVEVNDSSFVGISMRSPGSSISMSLICCFRSLISLDNPVIFEGSSFSSVGKQLAKSCEAKSLDSSGFKEVTRSSISWLMSGYEGLVFIETTLASALNGGGRTEVSLVSLSFPALSSSSLLSEIMIGSSVRESGVKKADLVSFKMSDKSSNFTFHEMSSALDSSFAPAVVWVVFNPSPADLVLSTRTLGLDPASM
ncbi:hypothetical protein Tco_0928488 [Tanacetum coccineum]